MCKTSQLVALTAVAANDVGAVSLYRAKSNSYITRCCREVVWPNRTMDLTTSFVSAAKISSPLSAASMRPQLRRDDCYNHRSSTTFAQLQLQHLDPPSVRGPTSEPRSAELQCHVEWSEVTVEIVLATEDEFVAIELFSTSDATPPSQRRIAVHRFLSASSFWLQNSSALAGPDYMLHLAR